MQQPRRMMIGCTVARGFSFARYVTKIPSAWGRKLALDTRLPDGRQPRHTTTYISMWQKVLAHGSTGGELAYKE